MVLKLFPSLESLLCVRHLSQRDAKKIDKLLVSAKGNQRENARAKAELLKDIRGA